VHTETCDVCLASAHANSSGDAGSQFCGAVALIQ
jgi:hypothetical protein